MSKSIGGQFVPMLHAVLDAPAWRALSHGARSLHLSLKRRCPRNRNVAFVSYRDAAVELGIRGGLDRVGTWFRELQHYGFIVQASPWCLGVDGKGKAAHWRLTELGTTSKTSAGGLPEPPTRDYLKWDGVLFQKPRRRNKIPFDTSVQTVRHVTNIPVRHARTPKGKSVRHVPYIESDQTVRHVQDITSNHSTALSPSSKKPSRKPQTAHRERRGGEGA